MTPHHNTIISLVILGLNTISMMAFSVNVSVRLRRMISSDTKDELDYHFKILIVCVIGIILNVISFYLGVKIWLKLTAVPLDSILNLRLVFAVLMSVLALMISIIDKRYNPFDVRK